MKKDVRLKHLFRRRRKTGMDTSADNIDASEASAIPPPQSPPPSSTPVVMPNEVEITVPGTFVVFQGIPGDGLSNTIDTAPFLMEDYDHIIEMDVEEQGSDPSGYHHVADSRTDSNAMEHDVISYDEESSEEGRKRPATTALGSTSARSPMMMGAYDSLLSTNASAAATTGATTTPVMTPLVLTASAATAPPPSGRSTRNPVDASFVVVTDEEKGQQEQQRSRHGLSRAQWEAIGHWETECRNREVRERKEWEMLGSQAQDEEEEEMWWQSQGRLAVLEGLPTLKEEGGKIHYEICGSLTPGCTVIADQLVTLDSDTFQEIKDTKKSPKKQRSEYPACFPRGKKGVVQILRIESPQTGFVVLSLDGYAFMGPGVPSTYTDSHSWMWRVTCPDGAYVRDGLELTSNHAETIPYGSFLRISRKTVNSMGLSRLRVHAILDKQSDENELTTQVVEGWISEELNPLSGQRGFIVQPVPFPVPVLYRVRLACGAVIRSDVELSSSQIGHAPIGAILTVVGRAYSNHPADHCIERFQLAGCGGWVSVRLNRAPPRNELVLEMVGVDGSFDPESPGVFHLNAHDKVKSEQVGDLTEEEHREDSDQREMYRRMSSSMTGDLSSINENSSSSSSLSQLDTTVSTGNGAAVPTLFRRGVAGGSASVARSGSGSKMGRRSGDEHCLICLTEDRNSTIVHGETGHIACCLKCARILKARGDKCPVCRLPIDAVIQHFWA